MKTLNLFRFALLLCISQAAVNAQAVASASSQANSSKGITINASNVSTRQVLEEIARQAGLKLIYKRGVLTEKTVSTVRLDHASVDVALNAVMKGTGATAKLGSDGETILVAIAASPTGRAQSVIVGKVTDAKSGKGISGANVSVDNGTSGIMTGENGSYRIAGIPSGSHTITVRLVGYAKQIRPITIGEGATVTADFKLEASANVLDQVVVTGTIVSTELKAVPNAITIITAKQLQERGITKIDQLFRGDVPGMFAMNRGTDALLDEVTMFSRGPTAISNTMQGSFSAGTERGTNPIKTFIDGVEMADSKYLSQIDPRSIERIEILTGPQASTIYGANAINGVMQVFTKRGSTSKPRILLDLTTGAAQNNFNNHLAPSHRTNANASGIEGRLSYNVNTSWDYEGAWSTAKRTQRLNANGGGRFELGKATVDMSMRGGLTKNSQQGNATSGFTQYAATGIWLNSGTRGIVVPRTQTLNGQTKGLRVDYRPLSWWSHQITLGTDVSATEDAKYRKAYVRPDDSTFIINGTTTSRVSQGYAGTLQFPVTTIANLNLSLGGDHWRTKSSIWSATPPLSLVGVLSGTSITRDRPSKNSGAFAQGQLAIKDALFFTYGLRVEWNPTIGGEAKVLPGRYGVSYTHEFGMVSAKLRGSYGRSIRPPLDKLKLGRLNVDPTYTSRYGTFYFLLPNPDLGPENNQGGEGGGDLYFGNRGSIGITRYNQTINDLIYEIGNSFAGSPKGIDSARSLLPNAALISNGSGGCSAVALGADGYCYIQQSQYLNAGAIRNQGWELQGSVNLGPLTSRGTYSWTKSRIIGLTPRYARILQDVGFTRGRSFDFAPEHTWALGFTYAHMGSTVSLNVNGIAQRYGGNNTLFDLSQSGSMRIMTDAPLMSLSSAYRTVQSGYTFADINATHNVTSWLDASLQIHNLMNDYVSDAGSRNSAVGRQSNLGFRIRFN